MVLSPDPQREREPLVVRREHLVPAACARTTIHEAWESEASHISRLEVKSSQVK